MNAKTQRFSLVVIAMFFLITLIVLTASASTTISTNIQTDGTLSVTGASTLTGLTSMIQASSTRLSVVGTAYFGGTATSTFDSAGNLSVIGTLGVTGVSTLTGLTSMIQASSTRLSVIGTAYFGGTATSTFDSAGNLTVIGTLGVTGVSTHTGLASFGQASSTRLSVFDTAYFGGTATSTFNSAGVLTLQNGETITNATNNIIEIGATTLKLIGTASTSALIVGDEPAAPTINGLVFGYCSFGDVTLAASSTAGFANCTATPAGSLLANDRVFVQATSSFESQYIITAASTTDANTIQLRILNTGLGTADPTLSGTSVNFWAVR